jgi:hypothetical protein
MNQSSLFARLVIPTCFLFVSVVGIGSARGGGKKDQTDKTKAILKQQLDNAKKLHDYAFSNYSPGSLFTVDQVVQAKRLLLQVQLELCERKQERLKVYENALKGVAELEKAPKETLALGTGGKFGVIAKYDILVITAYRLELELALEREKNTK